MEQESIGAVIGFIEASGPYGYDYLRHIDPTLPYLDIEQELNNGVLTSEWNQNEIGKSDVDIKWDDSYEEFANKSNRALDILEAKMVEAGMMDADSELER